MRTIGAAFLAATLVVSSVFVAPGFANPLANGKPAGVTKAQVLGGNTGAILIGAGVLAGTIALVASNSGGDGVTTPTTTSTSTTGLP